MSSKHIVRMPSVTSVVARSYPDKIIGVDNRLPWHLGSDLKNFRKLTTGHAIIMGRKTYESIGKPLPKRMNIVLTREPIQDSENLRWVSDPETALLLADFYTIGLGQNELFVIGGEKIYSIFHKYINKIYLTDVNCGPINGDAKFEYEFKNDEWYYRSEKEYQKSDIDEYSFRISTIVRRKPVHRKRSRFEFMSHDPKFNQQLDEYVENIETEPEEQFDLLHQA